MIYLTRYVTIVVSRTKTNIGILYMPPQNNIQIQPNIVASNTINAYSKTKLLAKRLLVIAGLTILILAFTYTIRLILPKSIQFNYTANTCINQPIIIPSTIKSYDSSFAVQTSDNIKLANVPLASKKLCIKPTSTPIENTKKSISLKLFGIIPIKKLTITSAKFPSVDFSIFNEPIPSSKPIKLKIDNEDTLFIYKLHSNEKSVSCDVKNKNIECPINQLNLVPGSMNSFSLDQTFQDKFVSNIFKGDVKTLDPLNIIGGNTTQDNTIFDQPNTLDVVFDKPVIETATPKLQIKKGTSLAEVATSYSIQDNKLLIKPRTSLERRSTYLLTIDYASSAAGNTLTSAYKSEFNVSGGPKVISHNTGTYAFEPSKDIILKFNQPIKNTDRLTDKIKIIGTNIPSFNVTVNNNTVIINPNDNLPSCTTITIQIDNTLQNIYGIDGDSGWKHDFRTLCRRSSVIGTSSQGRNIVAHWFGTGSSVILFIGGIHGNEKSSVLTMESWLDELERYSERIPIGRSIVVITTINPDGYSSNSRFNARGVDLNRNFPRADWSPNVSGPGYANLINGGGTSPLSEPESTTIATFIQQHRPRLVLSFHSAGGFVNPNYAGDSDSIARLYTSKTPYRYANNDQTNATLGYTTTGDFEFWLGDVGIPNIIIEHSSLSKNEFTKNRDALWAMVGL